MILPHNIQWCCSVLHVLATWPVIRTIYEQKDTALARSFVPIAGCGATIRSQILHARVCVG